MKARTRWLRIPPRHKWRGLLRGSDEEDVKGRPEVASALLAITAGTLKGHVLKGKANAADALFILAHCAGPFGTEFATAIGGLYRACAKMSWA